MARTLTVSLDHEYTSRAGTMTVGEALAWVEEHAADESEEEGEGAPRYSPGDLIVYGVRRMMALHRDTKRHDKGALPRHFYSVRLDAVKRAPKPLVQVVENVAQVEAKYAPEALKPKRAANGKSEPRSRRHA